MTPSSVLLSPLAGTPSAPSASSITQDLPGGGQPPVDGERPAGFAGFLDAAGSKSLTEEVSAEESAESSPLLAEMAMALTLNGQGVLAPLTPAAPLGTEPSLEGELAAEVSSENLSEGSEEMAGGGSLRLWRPEPWRPEIAPDTVESVASVVGGSAEEGRFPELGVEARLAAELKPTGILPAGLEPTLVTPPVDRLPGEGEFPVMGLQPIRQSNVGLATEESSTLTPDVETEVAAPQQEQATRAQIVAAALAPRRGGQTPTGQRDVALAEGDEGLAGGAAISAANGGVAARSFEAGGNSSNALGKKSTEVIGKKMFARSYQGLGTDTANRGESSMLSNAHTLLSGSLSAQASGGLLGAKGESSQDLAGTQPSFAAQASETVQALQELTRTLESETQNSVRMEFAFGENEKVAVKMQLRDGQVHATFQSSSEEVRAALMQSWKQQGAAENATRPIDATFISTQNSGQTGADTLGGQGQQSASHHFQEQASALSSMAALNSSRRAASTGGGETSLRTTSLSSDRLLHVTA